MRWLNVTVDELNRQKYAKWWKRKQPLFVENVGGEYHWVQILYFFCTYNFQIMLLIQYLKVSCKCQNIPEVEVLVFVRAWDCKPADFGELSWCHFRKRKLARGGHVLELG